MDKILLKIKNTYKQKLPFVIYRKPNENVINTIIQKSDKLSILENYTQTGFVFAPFNNNKKTILFPFDECNSQEIIIDDNFKLLIKNKALLSKNMNNMDFARSKYIDLVDQGIDHIKKGGTLKIVLSRKEEIELERFDIENIFYELTQIYPSAFVYVWFHPKVGLWIGASPETLLKINNQKFTTMSLAGTQVFNKSTNVIWGEKEIQEQKFVTDFIVKKINNKNIQINKPFTLRAGNLLHICTVIEGKVSGDLNLENLVEILHPTPAVCGLPKKNAKDFILKNEDYNREYYTGFLGEINKKLKGNNNSTETNLFVNLRCMQLKDQKFIFYIGSGITIDSDSESEWKETVSKSFTLKSVLS